MSVIARESSRARSSPNPNLITDRATISSWNRGPITTLYAHPPSCTETFTFTAGTRDGDRNDLYVGHHGNPVSAACYPRGTPGAMPLGDDDAWTVYYYSPAICPLGWTTATTFRSSVPYFGRGKAFVLDSETSAALCCPSGFSYKGSGHQCSSSITDGQVITFVSQTFDGQAQSWIRGDPIVQQQIPGKVLSADGVPIQWQSTDAEMLSRAASMTATPWNGPPTPGNEPPLPEPAGGLSTGAKIGIGVGVSLAVILGLVVFWLVWRSRGKRRKGKATYEIGGSGGGEGGVHEKYASTAPAYVQRNEAAVHELQSEPVVLELPGAVTGTAQKR